MLLYYNYVTHVKTKIMEKSSVWGEWNFSPGVQTKINTLCSEVCGENKNLGPEDEVWYWIVNQVNHYKILKKSPETGLVTKMSNSSVEGSYDEVQMEVDLQSKGEQLSDDKVQTEPGDSRTVENSVILLLNALDSPEHNTNNILDVIKGIPDYDFIEVVQEVWTQLRTDSSRLSLCKQLVENNKTSVILCQYILLPWLLEGQCTSIEAVSEILPHCADVACKTLILPLLASKDSPFVLDIFSMKDLTAHLQADNWCLILCEFIRSITSGLEKWHLPVIAVGVENSQGARRNLLDDVLNNLVVLMSCHVKDFAKDRDFGNIMIAIINCLGADMPSYFTKQMTDLAQSYSGPLRYKAINMLKSVNI